MDDDLPEADCQTLERHLKECRCCSDALKGLRRTIDACRKAARTKLPSSVKHRVVERINAILARG